MGPTAGGKSLILALIVGLIQPTEGTIYIDNKRLDQYEPKKLYKQLGLVFQDSILFNASIKENIILQEEELSLEQNKNLEKAIQTALLDDLIKNLPNGLDTIITERGGNLSGGQKKELC